MPGDPDWKRVSDRRHAFNAWRMTERDKWRDHPAARDTTLGTISIKYAGYPDPHANVPAGIRKAKRLCQLRLKDETLSAESKSE